MNGLKIYQYDKKKLENINSREANFEVNRILEYKEKGYIVGHI